MINRIIKSLAPSKVISTLLALFTGLLAATVLSGCKQEITGILNPQGVIAYEERVLMFDSMALMLIVVIPVIIMSFAFIVRYRASHRTADYKPNWSHSLFLELLWWGIPIVIIVVMGIMSWNATHKLDPYRKIDGAPVAMHIQVISLPWKWLFIYPEYGVAAVNDLTIPVGKQIEFDLTSDNAAMAAFFVPQLGSQIYTMAGMRTKLHLIGTKEGTYRGLNSQYNGEGFSDMIFPAHVVSDAEMQAWLNKNKASANSLSVETYQQIRKPSIADKAQYFKAVAPGLFEKVIAFYMGNHQQHNLMSKEADKAFNTAFCTSP